MGRGWWKRGEVDGANCKEREADLEELNGVSGKVLEKIIGFGLVLVKVGDGSRK